MSEMLMEAREVVAIDDVRPYWRNPRRVTEEAVNMLRKSIEDFGYQQPIVVDEDYVIIAGHTRYAALRRMGVTEAPVIVAKTLTEEQVKQFRLIDNKAGEFSTWDFTTLMDEIEDLDKDFVQTFFPELSDVDDGTGVESDDAVIAREWDKVQDKVEFICPSCFHGFEILVTKGAIMSGLLKASE